MSFTHEEHDHDHSHSHDHNEGWSWELFGYTIAIIFVAAIGGVIPFLIKLIKNKTLAYRIIDIASVAASGLFLGGGIFHMLGEGLHYISDSGYDLGNYPLGYTLFGVTFFLIFLVDRVIVPHNHVHFGDLEDHHHHHNEGYDNLEENNLLEDEHNHDNDHHENKQSKAQKLVSEWTGIVVLIVALGGVLFGAVYYKLKLRDKNSKTQKHR